MAVDAQQQSPLFALPPEVREKIYGFLLAFRHADFEYSLRPDFQFLLGLDPGQVPPETKLSFGSDPDPNAKPKPVPTAAQRNYVRNFKPSYSADTFPEGHPLAPVPLAPPPERKYHIKPLPSAMLACKRLYHELTPGVHHTAVIRAMLQGRHVGVAGHGTFKPERLERLCLLISMEHANWNGWLRFVTIVVKRAGEGLREVVVDWEPRISSESPSGGVKKGFLAGQEARMEERFFEMLAGCKGLETLRLYGKIPERWGKRLRELCGERVRVIITQGKWWVEDESDSGVSIGPLAKCVDVMSVAVRM